MLLLDRAKSVVNLEKGSSKVMEACMSAVRRNGIVSVLSVYIGTYDNFPVGQFFDKGIILKGGQAPVHKHIDVLLKYVVEGKVKLDDIITHRLPLSEIEHAYHIFRHKEEDCVIEQANTIFFSGGDQFRLSTILGGTPIIDIISKQYYEDKNLVLAGTSAGAMVMYKTMVTCT